MDKKEQKLVVRTSMKRLKGLSRKRIKVSAKEIVDLVSKAKVEGVILGSVTGIGLGVAIFNYLKLIDVVLEKEELENESLE